MTLEKPVLIGIIVITSQFVIEMSPTMACIQARAIVGILNKIMIASSRDST